MRLRWDELERQRYEDMVSALVSRLHPDAQRIDGKGGDGGRDVQIVRGQADHVKDAFDLKSFTGRMASGRCRQAEHSLERAATLDPARWSLIGVPKFLVQHGYGPKGKNPKREVDRWRSESKRGSVPR